jgi:glycosyltransferase involved in cell wall biosynthesis
MRVTFVVPRYGVSIIGGAESAARAFAEHLVARKGWEVEVLTGCAEDFVTWDDVLAPGEESVNGVLVRRFASSAGRDPAFHPYSASLLADPARASLDQAERWIDLQGPVIPDLVEAAGDTDADVLIFYPYLYYPTVRVIGRVRTPTVLHPAAHDEPALHLPVFPKVFSAADGLVLQTTAERDLVQRTFPVATRHQLLVGLGVDDPDQMSADNSSALPAGSHPYLVCLGRVDRHKGSWLLASLFRAYKQRHPGRLRLVLAGPVVEAPEEHPDIDVVGPVSEQEKWALLQGAVALVSPSPWEAFSLVVAEAWSARTPVLVIAECAATVEHCRRSGGGLSFAGFGEFEAGLDLICADLRVRDHLGERGRAYVDQWFRWPRVIDRYADFVESVVVRQTRSDPMAERAGTGTSNHMDAQDTGAGKDLVDPESADRLGSGHR